MRHDQPVPTWRRRRELTHSWVCSPCHEFVPHCHWMALITRQSNHCGFSIYIFDNSKSKSMVRLVRAEKMVLSGLVFARKIARMILIQNIQGLMGPLMFNMAFMPLYMWEMWDVACDERTDARKVESRAVFSLSWIRNMHIIMCSPSRFIAKAKNSIII